MAQKLIDIFFLSFYAFTFPIVHSSVDSTSTAHVVHHTLTVFLDSSAVLECHGVEGSAEWNDPFGSALTSSSRKFITSNGTLHLHQINREDAGYYWCSRDGILANSTVWHLTIDTSDRFTFELESITYGWYAALGMLIIGITVGIMKIIVRVCCPTCHAKASAAARVQQMRHFIVGLETYRHEQAQKLWENYNSQAQRIKESCAVQMESLRDHYSTKIIRFRNYKLPFTTFRDQYWQQVNKVREYGSSQTEKLQENYVRNMARLRGYSVSQLEKFRQQYEVQHKHMAKILEAMNFNIDHCRTAEMTPSGSMHMDLSLGNMPIDPSALHHGSFDSVSVPADHTPFTVEVDCVQVASCSNFDMPGPSRETIETREEQVRRSVNDLADEERIEVVVMEMPELEPLSGPSRDESGPEAEIMDAPDPFKAFIS